MTSELFIKLLPTHYMYFLLPVSFYYDPCPGLALFMILLPKYASYCLNSFVMIHIHDLACLWPCCLRITVLPTAYVLLLWFMLMACLCLWYCCLYMLRTKFLCHNPRTWLGLLWPCCLFITYASYYLYSLLWFMFMVAFLMILLFMYDIYWSYCLYALWSMFWWINVHMHWSLLSYASVYAPLWLHTWICSTNWHGLCWWQRFLP